MADKTQKIALGSGDLYFAAYSGTIPEDATIETDANRLGFITGGATITYKPTSQTFKDDYGKVTRTVITSDEASLTSTLRAYSLDDMPVFAETARVTTKTVDSKTHKIIKIGGTKNATGQLYVFRFVQHDAELGDLRVTVVGKSQAELAMVYQMDNPTDIALNITAQSQDDDGTLVMIDEAVAA